MNHAKILEWDGTINYVHYKYNHLNQSVYIRYFQHNNETHVVSKDCFHNMLIKSY